MKIALLVLGLVLLLAGLGWWGLVVTGDLAAQDIGAAPWIIAGAVVVIAALIGLFIALQRRG